MRTHWFSAYLVFTLCAVWLFFSLDDPNSWTGLGYIGLAWLNLTGVIEELRRR